MHGQIGLFQGIICNSASRNGKQHRQDKHLIFGFDRHGTIIFLSNCPDTAQAESMVFSIRFCGLRYAVLKLKFSCEGVFHLHNSEEILFPDPHRYGFPGVFVAVFRTFYGIVQGVTHHSVEIDHIHE